jgi:hypothetical protein
MIEHLVPVYTLTTSLLAEALIVGEPGSGKTMAAFSLIEYLDEREKALQDEDRFWSTSRRGKARRTSKPYSLTTYAPRSLRAPAPPGATGGTVPSTATPHRTPYQHQSPCQRSPRPLARRFARSAMHRNTWKGSSRKLAREAYSNA